MGVLTRDGVSNIDTVDAVASFANIDGVDAAPAYNPTMMRGTTGYYFRSGLSYTGRYVVAVIRFKVGPLSTNQDLIDLRDNNGRRCPRIWIASTGTSVPGTVRVQIRNSSDQNLCNIKSVGRFDDDQLYMLFLAYDSINGAVVLTIDEVDVEDTGWANRVVTTGTPTTRQITAVRAGGGSPASNFVDGDTGYVGVGHPNTYVNDPTAFGTGVNPVEPDTTGWSQWGGVQPLLFNESGKMDQNLGVVPNLSKLGGTLTEITP